MKNIPQLNIHGLSKKTTLKDYLPEFVYGGIDGSVTTFAVVAGAFGANLAPEIVIILGFANLIADGFSMSVGNYLSTKSELEEYAKHVRIEQKEIEEIPEQETEEIRQIYRAKGFDGDLLEQVVSVITSNKAVWLDVMMKEELEMIPAAKRPINTALATFVSFIGIGLIPLIVYLGEFVSAIPVENKFVIASLLTGLSFIGIGLLKSYVNHAGKLRGILETLMLGGLAAVLAYFVGDVLEKIITAQ